MPIGWRLGVLTLQLVALVSATTRVTGQPVANETWFFAGLFAVAINRQLLEPYYPRPGDVIANSLLFLFLFFVTDKNVAQIGWNIAAISISMFGILAIIGVTGSRTRETTSRLDYSRAARLVSQIASAQVIYSIAFFLSLLEFRPRLDFDFWLLGAAWACLTFVGSVNWQSLWNAVAPGSARGRVEGTMGPSLLNVSAPTLPPQGTEVCLTSSSTTATGWVIKRISRKEDVWGQIHVSNRAVCESFLSDGNVQIEGRPSPLGILVGSVDAGSTDTELRFVATHPLRVGEIVRVPITGADSPVLYQLTRAVVENTDVKGGAHLFERAYASQVGVFDTTTCRLQRHAWVPTPGAPVWAPGEESSAVSSPGPGWEAIGHVAGTSVPIFLNLDAVSSGHLAILGMTKMGKSTLATRLAQSLSKTRCVTVLDLTGEWVGKKGFPRCDSATVWTSPGISVFEPEPGEVPAKRALDCLKFILDKAQVEYKDGTPFPRTIIVDEAHQFIPEPAGLAFNTPGRDDSYTIGLHMMQIRKFGISVVLISQRTAVVAKSALSQCENLIAFRSVDQTGLDYLEALAGENARHLLPKLGQGEALVFGPAVSSDLPVVVTVPRPEVASSAT